MGGLKRVVTIRRLSVFLPGPFRRLPYPPEDRSFVNQDLSGMISDRSFVDKDLTAAQGILNFYLSVGSTFIKDIPLKQK